jgi:3(or 17)beta-hydroxysteroid dehydrogenase
MNRLKGKVSIISGGANGIGESTSKLFAQEGSKVVVADLDIKNGEKVVKDIIIKGGDAIFLKLDVTKEDEWENVMEKTIKKYGLVNVLINNAGIIIAKDIEDTTAEIWDRNMEVNAKGVFLGCKIAIKAMKNNNQSCSIINRSSVAGQVGAGDLFAYCASKGAVTLLTKCAALSCCKKGYKIRVNSVHPAYVQTKLAEDEARDLGYLPEEYLKLCSPMHPIGFVGEPIDISYLDLYLASDESRWVTGAEYVIDGGWTAQ